MRSLVDLVKNARDLVETRARSLVGLVALLILTCTVGCSAAQRAAATRGWNATKAGAIGCADEEKNAGIAIFNAVKSGQTATSDNWIGALVSSLAGAVGLAGAINCFQREVREYLTNNPVAVTPLEITERARLESAVQAIRVNQVLMRFGGNP